MAKKQVPATRIYTRAATRKTTQILEQNKKRKKEPSLFDEFLHNHKKAPMDKIQYKDLGAFDDLLTDCFVDKVCFQHLPCSQPLQMLIRLDSLLDQRTQNTPIQTDSKC